jgi:hypothetical protein
MDETHVSRRTICLLTHHEHGVSRSLGLAVMPNCEAAVSRRGRGRGRRRFPGHLDRRVFRLRNGQPDSGGIRIRRVAMVFFADPGAAVVFVADIAHNSTRVSALILPLGGWRVRGCAGIYHGLRHCPLEEPWSTSHLGGPGWPSRW